MLISFNFLPFLFSSAPNGKKPQVFLAGVHNTPSKLRVRTPYAYTTVCGSKRAVAVVTATSPSSAYPSFYCSISVQLVISTLPPQAASFSFFSLPFLFYFLPFSSSSSSSFPWLLLVIAPSHSSPCLDLCTILWSSPARVTVSSGHSVPRCAVLPYFSYSFKACDCC